MKRSPELAEAVEAGFSRSLYYSYRRQGLTHLQIMDGQVPAAAKPPSRPIPGDLFARLIAKIPVARRSSA